MKRILLLLSICLLIGCTHSTLQKNNQSSKNQINSMERIALIGDLHILGLRNHSIFENATFYAIQGMSFDMLMNKKYAVAQGQMSTILESIINNRYQQIYLNLGHQEIDWISVQMFIEKYSDIIDILQEKLPITKIYIQSLGTMTHKNVSEKKINCYNKVLKQLCLKKQVTYIECSSILQTKMSSDHQKNIYFEPQTYRLWSDELMKEIESVGERE